jgi:nucleoid-associated protein EbfC
MFGSLGNLGNMASLLKQAQEIPKQLKEMQERMAGQMFEGEAGAGAVVATVNGKSDLVKMQIKPEVIKPEDREMLEDLVIAAVGAATAKARQAVQQETAKITGGLNLPPGMQGLLGG